MDLGADAIANRAQAASSFAQQSGRARRGDLGLIGDRQRHAAQRLLHAGHPAVVDVGEVGHLAHQVQVDLGDQVVLRGEVGVGGRGCDLGPRCDGAHRQIRVRRPRSISTPAASLPTARPPQLELSLHHDLASIENDWRAFEESADCTVFQTFDWLSTWLRNIGVHEGAKPAIVIGRHDGAILFLLPFAFETEWLRPQDHMARLVPDATTTGRWWRAIFRGASSPAQFVRDLAGGPAAAAAAAAATT